MDPSIQQLELLYHLADRVGRAKDLTSVCHAAIDSIMAAGAARASVLLFDEAGVMRFRAWRHLSDRYRAAVDGHSPWSRDTSVPVAIVVPDVASDSTLGALRDAILAEGIRALAFVPLVSHGRLLGKFMVYYDAPHGFADDELRLAGSIAQHVAFAVARVRADAAIEELLLREQGARRDIDAARVEADERRLVAEELARLARALNETLDVTSVAERIVDAALGLFRARASALRLAAPDGSLVGVAFGGGMKAVFPVGHTVPGGRASISGLAMLEGTAVWTDDAFIDPRLAVTDELRQRMREAGDSAVLAAPLRNKGTVLGALLIGDKAGRQFSSAEADVLQAFADQAALAIENARLYEEARHRQREAERARAEADAANRAKDQFLAALSHELRTPLSAILGWARLLTAGRLDAAQQRHALAIIERNAQLQSELVSDLLDISRIVAGKLDIERVPVDLLLVVRAAVEAAGADFEAKDVRLVTDLDATAGEIFGEPRRLQQVVANLLSNAVKFTPPGGIVDVRLVRHEASARLTVSDTGEGVDPALVPRIFDPFEQGDPSTTRRHQGLGLGLAIVRQLVELHGGTIRAESEGKGKGATFTVDLPVLAVRRGRHRDGEHDAAPPLTGLEGCRVLIVDDQPDARELLAVAVGQSGAEVRVAASAGEALQILSEHDVDMLVSDIAMPEMDGFAFIETVRRRHAGRAGGALRAIAVTAHMGGGMRERALASGFDAHAVKPLNPDDFVRLLTKLRAV
jgi:signal transduction histidine kinase/CheY-like chemotaxis protein